MTLTVELPWPSPKLHPNARVHWAVKSKEAKKARKDAWLAGMMVNAQRFMDDRPQGERIPVALIFHPPDKRKRDLDGMLSASKSSLDGLADALMVNDNLFDLRLTLSEPVKGGKVVVTVFESPTFNGREAIDYARTGRKGSLT